MTAEVQARQVKQHEETVAALEEQLAAKQQATGDAQREAAEKGQRELAALRRQHREQQQLDAEVQAEAAARHARELEGVRQELEEARRREAEARQDGEAAARDKHRKDLSAMRAAHREQQQLDAEVHSEHSRRHEEAVAGLRDENADLRGELDRLAETRSREQRALQSAEQEAAAARGEAAGLRKQMTTQRQRQEKQSAAEAKALAKTASKHAKELAEKTQIIEGLRATLAEARVKAGSQHRGVEEMECQAKALAGDQSSLRARLSVLEAQEADSASRNAALQDHLRVIRNERDSLRRSAAATSADRGGALVEAQAREHKLAAEVAQLRQALQAAQEQLQESAKIQAEKEACNAFVAPAGAPVAGSAVRSPASSRSIASTCSTPGTTRGAGAGGSSSSSSSSSASATSWSLGATALAMNTPGRRSALAGTAAELGIDPVLDSKFMW